MTLERMLESVISTKRTVVLFCFLLFAYEEKKIFQNKRKKTNKCGQIQIDTKNVKKILITISSVI